MLSFQGKVLVSFKSSCFPPSVVGHGEIAQVCWGKGTFGTVVFPKVLKVGSV